jgi:serine/threonine-protein kinase
MEQSTWVENGSPAALVLPGYQILGELGRGGMGVVYKARHERMNRVVALKVINKEHLPHADAIRRFYREIEAAAQLAHPNIVIAFDAGQCGERHYLSMEYVEGVDLKRLIRHSGPLPIDRCCDFIRQAALGLQHAHERGLVHRDIKPSNLIATWGEGMAHGGDSWNGRPRELLSTDKATVKILDLGLALLCQPDAPASCAMSGESRVVGTADYMAPEQWMNPHTVDIRADLYSLGCTFYFLLTGQVPFPGDETMEKMLKHNLDEPAPVERLRVGVPQNVLKVVRRLLAKKPDQRYQQPADLLEALRS